MNSTNGTSKVPDQFHLKIMFSFTKKESFVSSPQTEVPLKAIRQLDKIRAINSLKGSMNTRYGNQGLGRLKKRCAIKCSAIDYD